MSEIDLGVDVGTLNEGQIDSEIGSIRQDPDFLKGEGSIVGGNKRAAALNARMEALYKRRYPEPAGRQGELDHSVSDLARKAFGTDITAKEITDEGNDLRQEVVAQQDHMEYLQVEGQLRQIWPNEESYNQNISRVHFAVDQIIKDPGERQQIIDAYGNDLEMVQALAVLVSKLEAVFPNFKDAKSYKREKK